MKNSIEVYEMAVRIANAVGKHGGRKGNRTNEFFLGALNALLWINLDDKCFEKEIERYEASDD